MSLIAKLWWANWKIADLKRIEDENTADLLLFNTCSIRDLAERKVMGKLGKLGRNLQHQADYWRHRLHGKCQKRHPFSKTPPY